MHEVDLSRYNIRTDLIIDEVDKFTDLIDVEEKNVDLVNINTTVVKKDTDFKKKGIYKTISFEDITDTNNFDKVLNVFSRELSSLIATFNLKDDYKVLVVGLGNRSSTPDSLGVKVCDNIVVTRHLYLMGSVDKSFKNVASFTPNVMGNTGLEGLDIIEGILSVDEFDLVIVVDALSSTNISRLNKTIQLTNTGISPGSGIGNYRKEISFDTLGIPVIAIGVPTVVDAVTIVSDTTKFLIKRVAYLKEAPVKDKLKKDVNYLESDADLSKEEKNNLLGILGCLSEEDLHSFISEVLNPIGYNMMVTPKEIDFLIYKLALLISKGINKVMHE